VKKRKRSESKNEKKKKRSHNLTIWKRFIQVIFITPETKWPIYEQVERVLTSNGGPNPRMWKNTGMICG
jgi:hypothetical protein